MMFQPYCFYGFFLFFCFLFFYNSVLSQFTLDLKQMLIANTNLHQNVYGVTGSIEWLYYEIFSKISFLIIGYSNLLTFTNRIAQASLLWKINAIVSYRVPDPNLVQLFVIF